ncbi:MAG: Nif3-like dinuclear metal center hexameric protein [Deltaproteobacteria bacterium]|nr:Nif3-like dinuclear metal center hexameric protein [Deltaproteobacteria bacterium]
MAISLEELVGVLDSELKIREFRDMSLNGLQIEGAPNIQKICTSVDAGESVVLAAIQQRAHVLIVHHGLFWGSPLAIRGSHKRVVKAALDNGLSLYACHLPLDAHQEWGNNVCLARMLGLSELKSGALYDGMFIGCVAENVGARTFDELCTILKQLPGAPTNFVTLPFGPQIPRKLCIVSGGGADTIRQAEADGFDTLITGEPKQYLYHYARERSLNVVCAGHYATETVGVQALGNMLATKFGVEHVFVPEPTGI